MFRWAFVIGCLAFAGGLFLDYALRRKYRIPEPVTRQLDFDRLIAAGESFTPRTTEEWRQYREWAARQVCKGCGRPRETGPGLVEVWATEVVCGTCNRQGVR